MTIGESLTFGVGTLDQAAREARAVFYGDVPYQDWDTIGNDRQERWRKVVRRALEVANGV